MFYIWIRDPRTGDCTDMPILHQSRDDAKDTLRILSRLGLDVTIVEWYIHSSVDFY